MTTLKLKNTTTELAAVVHKIQQSIAMQEQDCETKLLAKCGRITRAGIIITHRKHVLLLAYKILVARYKMLSLYLGNLVAISRCTVFPGMCVACVISTGFPLVWPTISLLFL